MGTAATLKQPSFRRRMRKVGSYWQVYVMMIPIIVFFLIFAYRPMYGIVIAFKDYMPSKGIMGSKWVGFEHFRWVFTTPEFGRAFRNTLIISFAKLFLFSFSHYRGLVA